MNILLRELNPAYDLSRHSKNASLGDYALFGLNLCKSLVRGNIAGAIVGSAVGTMVSVVAGKDLPEFTLDAILFGMFAGAQLDQIQYCCRYIAYRVERFR